MSDSARSGGGEGRNFVKRQWRLAENRSPTTECRTLNTKLQPLLPIALSAALALAGCGSIEPVAPQVTDSLAASARVDVELLEHGRLIYTTRCVLCHTSERVGKYSRREWMGILERMSAEAGLNDAQDRAVRAYVMALVER